MSTDYFSSPEVLLDSVIRRRARKLAEKPFAIFPERDITYAAFDAGVEQVARGLTAIGIRPDDAVGLCMSRRPEFLYSMFGIHRAGGVCVPLATYAAADELRDQIGSTGAKAVITDSLDAGAAEAIAQSPGLRVVTLEPAELAGAITYEALQYSGSASELAWRPSADDRATIMFTSGTTSRPKGVTLTHGNLLSIAQRLRDTYGWTSDDRLLHLFPLFHGNGGLMCLLPPLLAGATIVVAPKFSASSFTRFLIDYEITFCHVNSTHCKILLEQPPRPDDGAHRAQRMLLGLTLDPQTWHDFETRYNTTLCPSYGMTETGTVVVAASALDPAEPGSAGRVMNGYELAIADTDGTELPAGTDGEIVIRSSQRHAFMLRYDGDQQATDEVLRDGAVHSGDQGHFDDRGQLWVTGRIKDMIKHSGFNVAPAEIERVIAAIDGVAAVAVVGSPDRISDENVVAFVVLDAGTVLPADDVLEVCRCQLAHYKIPERVSFIEALPLNFVGKVDRKVLRAMASGATNTVDSRRNSFEA